MCSCDGERASAYRETQRTARKAHSCAECRATIQAGESYVYASGIWDGRPDSFAFCTECVGLRREWAGLAREHRLCGPCWEIGSMYEAIFEWVEEASFALMDRERQAMWAREHGTVVMGEGGSQ